MKKVKIMLMSMAILAIVGGALAFKAKFTTEFCTLTTTTGGALTCPITLATTLNGTIPVEYTFPEPGESDCPVELCTFETSIVPNS